MAKAFRASGIDNAINGGNCTIDLSALSVVIGDLVILVGCVPSAAGTGTPGLPGDYTALSGSPKSFGGAAAGRIYVGYKKLTAADASAVFTGDGDANSSVHARAYVFSGADFDTSVTPTTANGDSTNPDPPSITPDENATGVVIAAASRTVDNTPGNQAAYTNHVRSSSSTDANDIQLCMAWRDGMSSGVAENPAAYSSWSTGQWAAFTFCVKDAVVAAVVSPGPQGVGEQFVAFHDGTIDPTMHKIEMGIAT